MNLNDYEFYGARQVHRINSTVKTLLKHCKQGKILDAGIGNGNLAISLAKQGFDVYGLDISKKSINVVKEKINKEGLNISLNKGDIANIPFQDAFFDAVICAETLEYADDKKAMDEFHRVLKPNGICVVTVPVGIDGPDEWGYPFKRYTEQEVIQICSNGFKILKTEKQRFLLIRLFHHLIYKPSVKRKDSNFHKSVISKIANNFLLFLFKFDKLFFFTKNIGFVIIIQKCE